MKTFGYCLLVGLLRLLSILPYPLVARTGSGLGAVLYLIPSD
jgi:KDO2-lipid IV(A) lauroyltransferase